MKILIIRRDNIGDLVCTTPMIRMLREAYPEAWIGALVTRYNAEVLAGNDDLDAVYSYTKAKHREPGQSRIGIYLGRAAQLVRLRRLHLDYVLLPAAGAQPSAARFAQWLAPKKIITGGIAADAPTQHEVVRCAELLSEMGIHGEPPGVRIAANRASAEAIHERMVRAGLTADRPLVAIHISARKPSQRWPQERYAELMQALHSSDGTQFMLFWAPGDENNPHHPGDDQKAQAVLAASTHVPVFPCPTHSLRDLIAGLALVERVICSDGGAMHLAAALGKPIVALFGKSDAKVWHPWGVPYRVLQPSSRDVADVAVAEVFDACASLVPS